MVEIVKYGLDALGIAVAVFAAVVAHRAANLAKVSNTHAANANSLAERANGQVGEANSLAAKANDGADEANNHAREANRLAERANGQVEKANRLAARANSQAEEANAHAREANRLAERANAQVEEANTLAQSAIASSSENARLLGRVDVRRGELEDLRTKHEKLNGHLTELKNHMATIDTEARAEPAGAEDEDVIARSRAVSRAYRAAMLHYGESRAVFKLLKDQLGSEEVERLQKEMRDASRFFSENFDALRLREIVGRHRDVLEQLTETVGDALGELRHELDLAVGDGT